jgi:hypothetical protein
MKVEKKSELIGRGGFYRRPVDFPDFYTIKSLRVGDLGVKIKKILKNI